MEPWERQKEESSKAFHAFTHYRDLGPHRSLDGAYRQHEESCKGRHPGNKRATGRWNLWYSEWRWVSRVLAYDADLDRQQRERRQREILEARDRHANLARLVQNKFLERMRSMAPDEIPPAVLVQMLRVATDVELRALGEAMESVKAEVSGPGGRAIQYEDTTLKERIARYANVIDEIIAERVAGHAGGNGAGQPLDTPRPD